MSVSAVQSQLPQAQPSNEFENKLEKNPQGADLQSQNLLGFKRTSTFKSPSTTSNAQSSHKSPISFQPGFRLPSAGTALLLGGGLTLAGFAVADTIEKKESKKDFDTKTSKYEEDVKERKEIIEENAKAEGLIQTLPKEQQEAFRALMIKKVPTEPVKPIYTAPEVLFKKR